MKRRSSGWSPTFMSANTRHVHTASPPTTEKTILPILGWIPHLIHSETTYIWTTNQRSSIQAICEVCADESERKREREREPLPTPSVPLLKFPFDQRAHRSAGASNHIKESSVLMNILGPWAKASHGLALSCWGFDQPSFNLLSWVLILVLHLILWTSSVLAFLWSQQ